MSKICFFDLVFWGGERGLCIVRWFGLGSGREGEGVLGGEIGGGEDGTS